MSRYHFVVRTLTNGHYSLAVEWCHLYVNILVRSSALLMRMVTLDITIIVLLSTFKLIKGQFGNNIFNFLLNSLKHWHWIPKIQAVYLSLINTHVVTFHRLIAHFSICEPL